MIEAESMHPEISAFLNIARCCSSHVRDRTFEWAMTSKLAPTAHKSPLGNDIENRAREWRKLSKLQQSTS